MKSFNIHWLLLLLGIWIMISPWVMDFADITTMLWSNIIAGAFIVLVALWELFSGKAETPSL